MKQPPQKKPVNLVPDTYKPPAGRSYPVKNGESWKSIARGHGLKDPWDLIEFNFPGTKQTKQIDFQRATREVSWYLSEYVGCVKHDGKNFEFSSGLSKGKGAWKGGVIYLPPSPPPVTPVPPAAGSCMIIQIPSLGQQPPLVQKMLQKFKIQLPSRARCLDPKEVKAAVPTYGNSLDYNAIYVSDGVGGSGRPVTIALPIGGQWVVILNMGPGAFKNPRADKSTLIHELAHAWQSQHHPREPWRYMDNCAKSQIAAELVNRAAAVNSHPASRLVSPLPDLKVGEASAYAYVPGKAFGDYGGEQIAQQAEDSLLPGATGSAAKRIPNIMKTMSPNTTDPQNVRSLSTIRFDFRSTANVVWH